MLDVFTALSQKRARLVVRKQEIEREYKAKIHEIDVELGQIDEVIKTVNAALEDYICPTCGGSGNVRRCDAAGDMEDWTCDVCKGTGIKIDKNPKKPKPNKNI